MSRFDWHRLPDAELQRRDLQHGRENQNTECKCIDWCHATDYDYKCIRKCLVQTTVAPPSWFVYVRHGLWFWLWHWFYMQSPRITILTFLLWHKFVNFEKQRRWCVSSIWQFRGHFLIKVACGCLWTRLAGCLSRAHSWFWLMFSNAFGPLGAQTFCF